MELTSHHEAEVPCYVAPVDTYCAQDQQNCLHSSTSNNNGVFVARLLQKQQKIQYSSYGTS